MIPDALLHLVRNTPKEIKRNHLLAKIRLREREIRWIEKFKAEISDYFYLVETWPSYAIEIILTKHFGYSERIALACFFHGNGMKDQCKALRIFQVYNKAWTHDKSWSIAFRKFQNLFPYLENANDFTSDVGDHIRRHYYYYDMNLNLTIFYEGTIREKNGERRRYYPLFKQYKEPNNIHRV